MKKTSRVEKKLKRKKIFFRFILLIFLLSMSMMLALKTTFFNIKSIKVLGNNKISRDIIVSGSLINIGENIFKISTKSGEKSLYNLPYIKNVQIKRKFPNKIIIEIEERKEIGTIKNMNSYMYFDIDGFVLDIRNNEEENLPIIVGLNNIEKIKPGENIFNQVELEEVFDFIIQSNQLKMLSKMARIDLTNIDNINIVLKNSIVVAFGTIDNVEYKLSFLKEILEDIQKKQIKCKMILMNKGDNPVIITGN